MKVQKRAIFNLGSSLKGILLSLNDGTVTWTTSIHNCAESIKTLTRTPKLGTKKL